MIRRITENTKNIRITQDAKKWKTAEIQTIIHTIIPEDTLICTPYQKYYKYKKQKHHAIQHKWYIYNTNTENTTRTNIYCTNTKKDYQDTRGYYKIHKMRKLHQIQKSKKYGLNTKNYAKEYHIILKKYIQEIRIIQITHNKIQQKRQNTKIRKYQTYNNNKNNKNTTHLA